MANKFMQSMGSAFDRLGGQGASLTAIEENTRETKENLAIGGDLYSRIDELVTAITDIQEGKGPAGGSDIKQALALAIVAPSIKTVGMGLQYVVDAVNSLEGTGDEIKLKMESLIGGLTKLGDVGLSILKFAGYMALATPFLLIAAVMSPIIALTLFMITAAITMSTKMLTKETMEKMEKLPKLGLGILALMASLALSSLFILPAIKGMFAVAIILPIMFFVLALAGIFVSDKTERVTDQLLKAALGILAITATLAIVGLIAPLAMKGIMPAMLIVLGIGIVFGIIGIFGDAIERGAKGLLLAAGAILGLAIALALFEIISPPMDQLLPIAMIVGAVGITFALIGIFGSLIEKGAKAMLWAGLAIVVLGLSLLILSKIVGNVSGMEAVKTIGALILIGLIGAAFYLAGTQALLIAQGAGAMILVGVAIMIIAIGFAILRKAIGDDGWTFIGQTMALIGGIGVAMGVAGLAAPFIAIGAASMILAGVALILVGAAMAILKKLDFNAMTKKGGILGPSGQKTKGFLGIGGGRMKTNLELMLESIAVSFMLNPFHVAAMYAGAPALIMAGAALLSIGAGISKFQKIAAETNLDTLGKNVNNIVFTLANTFGTIGKMFPGGQQSLFSSIFGGGGGSAVAQGISSTMGMGKALTGIARGMQAMANLKFPVEYDKEGNPIRFESMDSDAPQRVAKNAASITSTLATVFAEIGTKYPGGKKSLFQSIFGGGKSSAVADGISATMGMGKALTGIAQGFQAMADLKFATGYDKEGKPTGYESINIETSIPKVQENTRMIVEGLSGVFAQIGKNPDANDGSWWGGKSTIEKGVAIVQGFGKPLMNLGKGVQAMANLKFPTGFDKDGKPTGFETIKDIKGIKSKIGRNTRMLIEALTDVFTAIGGGKSKTSSWWQGATKFEKGIEIVNMVGEPYKKLSDSIKGIIDLVGKLDTKAFQGKVKDIINVFTADEIIGADSALMNSRKLLTIAIGDAFTKLSSSVPAITSALADYDTEKGKAFFGAFIGPVDPKDVNTSYDSQKLLWNAIGSSIIKTKDSMPGITAAINEMDLEKLVESRKMFEALGVLSNGGEPSDILAAMGESLEEALQNLADMLGEFQSSVAENSATTGGALSGLTDGIKKMAGVGSRPKTSGGGGGDSDDVVRAVKQLQSTLVSQGIKVKSSGGFFG
jgi:hypothetical protein